MGAREPKGRLELQSEGKGLLGKLGLDEGASWPLDLRGRRVEGAERRPAQQGSDMSQRQTGKKNG